MIVFSVTNALNVEVDVIGIKLKFSMGVTAVDGVLELDLKLPADFFGILRKKAGDLIIQKSAQVPNLRVWKHTNGNLRLSYEGVQFTSCFILDGVVNIGLGE